MGDGLGPELATCLPIFLDRLKNEITRLTAVKALSMIAEWVLSVWRVLCMCLQSTDVECSHSQCCSA